MRNSVRKRELSGRPPSWLIRVKEIMGGVSAGPETLTRRHVEALFCVGKRQAIFLMRRVGCMAGDTELFVTKSAVLCFLQPYVEEQERAFARLGRVAKATRAVCFVPAESARRGAENGSRATGIEQIPGIRFNPGQLTVTYVTTEQLYERLVGLAIYLGQHPEAFNESR
jgi:hypothetical protein